MPLQRAAFLFLNSGVHQLTALWVLMDKQRNTGRELHGITLLFFLLAFRSSVSRSDSKLSDSRVVLFWPCFLLRQQGGLNAIADMQFLQNIGYIMFDGFFGQE